MTKISNRRLNVLAKRNARRELDQARFGTAIRAIVHKPVFEEDKDGNRIRVWSDCSYDKNGKVIPSLDTVKDEDVRGWLLNLRVTSKLEALEYVHEKYLAGMIRDGLLRVNPICPAELWVTDKAAARWNLPRVLGCKFPPATGAFGTLAPRKAA